MYKDKNKREFPRTIEGVPQILVDLFPVYMAFLVIRA